MDLFYLGCGLLFGVIVGKIIVLTMRISRMEEKFDQFLKVQSDKEKIPIFGESIKLNEN